MTDKKPPKKVKISKATGSKLRKSAQAPKGNKEGLLAKIAEALRKKNQ